MNNPIVPVADLLKAANDQIENGKKLIAVLYKQAEEQFSENNDLRAQLEAKGQKVQKQASDQAAEKGLNESDVRTALTKLADQGVLSDSSLDMHVQAAVDDPSHLTKMVKVAADSLAEAQSRVAPAGKLQKSAGEAADASSRERIQKKDLADLSQDLTELANNI